ncbi:hypothetical protein BJ742DRAFT_708481 [Cladochytrium replicatum]|nr:hypothetical protein BJ742DRAFT_708481 [Cladochytrium replicatum]
MADGKLPQLPNKHSPQDVEGDDSIDNNEIPIAARSKGPGPAAYTLPSTIGLNAKTGKRAPAYSFGMKLNNPNADSSPGPNKFFPQTTRTGSSNGPAFSLQGNFKKTRSTAQSDLKLTTMCLGPGKYNPTYIPAKEPRAPAYSIGGRRNMDKGSQNFVKSFIYPKANMYPGPAEYSITSTLGLRPAINIRAAAAYTIKPPRPIKLESFSPGPAAYAALNPSKIKRASPAYSLGSRWPHDGGSPFSDSKDAYEHHEADGSTTKVTMPGPGHYTPMLNYSKDTQPTFSFRVKHSEYELFVPDTQEGEFIF